MDWNEKAFVFSLIFNCMKKSLVLFILLLFTFSHSQTITGTIYTKVSNQPIPYAIIGIEKENIGTIADENGQFTLELSQVNSSRKVIVDVAGYELFTESIEQFISHPNKAIYLEEEITELSEIVLEPKVLIDKNWGVKSKSKSVLYEVNPEKNKDHHNLETAFQFNTKKKAKINTIHLNVASIETDEPIVLRYTIYNEKEGMPYKNILDEELTFELTQAQLVDGTFSIDVTNHNIWVQGKFFVAIHFLNHFQGKLLISAALMRTGYVREFYGDWHKTIIAAPAINIDVKVDKHGKN